jgi:hypothetical protein
MASGRLKQVPIRLTFAVALSAVLTTPGVKGSNGRIYVTCGGVGTNSHESRTLIVLHSFNRADRA